MLLKSVQQAAQRRRRALCVLCSSSRERHGVAGALTRCAADARRSGCGRSAWSIRAHGRCRGTRYLVPMADMFNFAPTDAQLSREHTYDDCAATTLPPRTRSSATSCTSGRSRLCRRRGAVGDVRRQPGRAFTFSTTASCPTSIRRRASICQSSLRAMLRRVTRRRSRQAADSCRRCACRAIRTLLRARQALQCRVDASQTEFPLFPAVARATWSTSIGSRRRRRPRRCCARSALHAWRAPDLAESSSKLVQTGGCTAGPWRCATRISARRWRRTRRRSSGRADTLSAGERA
jgi:hypothetical protein